MTIAPMKEPDTLSPCWQEVALCRRTPGVTIDDFFYNGRWRRGSKAMLDHIERLKALCKACPVRQECDEHAEQFKAEGGFRAGLTWTQRKKRRLARQGSTSGDSGGTAT